MYAYSQYSRSITYTCTYVYVTYTCTYVHVYCIYKGIEGLIMSIFLSSFYIFSASLTAQDLVVSASFPQQMKELSEILDKVHVY